MKICSVIVSYNPDVQPLTELCMKLLESRSAVVIVDNTEKSKLPEFKGLPDCVLLRLGENTGIAHAQNVGIKRAIKDGAEVIVLFDQDSKIEESFLSFLLAPLKVGEPGVVAPVFFDEAKGFEFPALKLGKCGCLVKTYREGRILPYGVDVVTASGTAATAVTFDIAGLMDEDFFIDLVDTEWSLRCRSKNIPIQIVPAAVMKHSVGAASIDFGVMRGFVHSPERCYYQIRNCFLLFKKESVPLLVASREILSVFIHHMMSFIFLKSKPEYIRNYSLAIAHGVSGVVGKKPA